MLTFFKNSRGWFLFTVSWLILFFQYAISRSISSFVRVERLNMKLLLKYYWLSPINTDTILSTFCLHAFSLMFIIHLHRGSSRILFNLSLKPRTVLRNNVVNYCVLL